MLMKQSLIKFRYTEVHVIVKGAICVKHRPYNVRYNIGLHSEEGEKHDAFVVYRLKKKCIICSPSKQAKTPVSFVQNAVAWRHNDWCIRPLTRPQSVAYWSGDSAIFWSQCYFVPRHSLYTEKYKMAFEFSEQNLMADMLMHLLNVFPSVCLRWNEACNGGSPPNNWLLEITLQVPCSATASKTCLWQNVYDPTMDASILIVVLDIRPIPG